MDPNAPHLRPWRRTPYLAVLLGVLAVLVSWLGFAAAVFLDPARTHICSLTSAGVILVLLAFPFAIARRAKIARASAAFAGNEDALAHLRAGRYAEAAAVWDDLARGARHAPVLHALYVFNLGMAWLHLGRLAEARALIDRAIDTRWFASRALRHVEPQTELGRALALALAGDIEAARRARDALLPKLGAARRAATTLVDAVIAARAGEAVALGEDTLRNAEGSLMPAHIRAVRLLEVFARSGREGAAYRDGVGADRVEAIGVNPGELDFLGAEWPEVRAFMGARGLLAS